MAPIKAIADLSVLIEKKTRYASASRTEPSEERGNWVIENNTLKNNSSDFFSISLYETAKNETRYLIEQNNGALVMLLVAEQDGEKIALLNTRFEPGLIDQVNYTCTIQSTPSNYKREHGGKPTPFIEVIEHPERYGQILYDGEHYDWGGHYLLKKKRYLVVKLSKALQPPDGYVWVTYSLLDKMLQADNLITNDLRVTLPLLRYAGQKNAPGPNPAALFPAPAKLAFNCSTLDTSGAGITFFRTTTAEREVSTWIQPLLVLPAPMKIRLSFSGHDQSRLFALQQRTQVGLRGMQLWFPAYIDGSSRHRHVSTCAEGGRFWKHPIEVETGALDEPTPIAVEDTSICWKTERELLEIITTPLASSLELRMAASLMIKTTCHD